MASPLAFGGPLRACGLCRGLCSDAPPIYTSKPTIAGPLSDHERLILMRIDAGVGAISSQLKAEKEKGHEDPAKATHR